MTGNPWGVILVVGSLAGALGWYAHRPAPPATASAVPAPRPPTGANPPLVLEPIAPVAAAPADLSPAVDALMTGLNACRADLARLRPGRPVPPVTLAPFDPSAATPQAVADTIRVQLARFQLELRQSLGATP